MASGEDQEADMDHGSHRPGTERTCVECRRIAYEPGWYATLLVFGTNEPEEPALVSVSAA
jgi:hypothetical protein